MAVLEAFWAVLGPSCAVLGRPLGPLGRPWGYLGNSWGCLGLSDARESEKAKIIETLTGNQRSLPRQELLGPLRASWRSHGGLPGASWGLLGASWGPLVDLLWASWGPFGASREPDGGLGGLWGQKTRNLCWSLPSFFIWRLVARMLLRVSAKGLPMDVLNNVAARGTHRVSYFYNTLPTCLRSETNCTTSSILRDANSTCPLCLWDPI